MFFCYNARLRVGFKDERNPWLLYSINYDVLIKCAEDINVEGPWLSLSVSLAVRSSESTTPFRVSPSCAPCILLLYFFYPPILFSFICPHETTEGGISLCTRPFLIFFSLFFFFKFFPFCRGFRNSPVPYPRYLRDRLTVNSKRFLSTILYTEAGMRFDLKILIRHSLPPLGFHQ